jgi:hypothetical protein
MTWQTKKSNQILPNTCHFETIKKTILKKKIFFYIIFLVISFGCKFY